MKEIKNECEDCGINLETCGMYWKTQEEQLCASCAEHRGYEIN